MPDPPASDLEVLKTSKSQTLTLLSQLLAAPTTPPSTSSKINALALASDSALLLRAHVTKLSLLVINTPFTPTAITKILRELIAGPIPGLASAVEICAPSGYTRVMSVEMGYRVRRVLGELEDLVKLVPEDGKVLSEKQKEGDGRGGTRGSMALTGAVWEACDEVVALGKLGVAGLVVKKAEEWKALLKDALEELQEWGEEGSDDDEEDIGSVTEGGDQKQREVDELFGSERHIPTEDPEKIRPRLEASCKRIRLVGTFYQAAIKRRFRSLPPIPRPDVLEEHMAKLTMDTENTTEKSEANAEPPPKTVGNPGIVSEVDQVMEVMKKIPEATDEWASAFYELDSLEIDKRMNECFVLGFAAAELLTHNWDGQKDEFSAWVSVTPFHFCTSAYHLQVLKFQDAMKKGW